jgi:hypothetical protein
LLVAVLACGSEPSAEAPAMPPPAAGLQTKAGRYRLQWSAEPAPVPFNTLFSVRTVLLTAAGEPVQDGAVGVDASMPQHGHGMPTHPVAEPGTCTPSSGAGAAETCVHPDGVYLSSGMKLHMQGEWVIHFDVSGPAGSDSLDVHYSL